MKTNERIKELTEFTKDIAFIANQASYSVNDVKIIDDISLRIDFGETFVIMGPSGAGKTMLMKLLFGLIYPTKGEIFIKGFDTKFAAEEKLMSLCKDMEFIFQFGSLINNMNVRDNIALMNIYHHVKSDKELEDEIDKNLKYFNLSHRKFVRPSGLTLSEKKSIGFCRMLINDFDIVFLDEPFASTDEVTRKKLLKHIKTFKKQGKTLIISTLEIDFAIDYADKICLLEHGKLVFLGTIPELRNSTDVRVKAMAERLSNISESQKDLTEE